MNLILRPFEEADLELSADLYTETFARPPWNEVWDRRVVLARLRQIADTPHCFGLVATAEASGNGGSAGFRTPELLAFVIGYSEPYHDGFHFYLKEMCVHPGHQRQGIGSRVMESLISILKERNNHRLYLLTSRGDMSEDFYTKAGFYTSRKMILMARVLKE